MKIFRRTLFFAFVSVLLGMLLTMFLPTAYAYTNPSFPSFFWFVEGSCLVGLLVWSMVFLEAEPWLTRTALLLILLCLLFIFYMALPGTG